MADRVQLNGIAHVYITVADFAACLPFYEKLLPALDMRCLVRTDTLYYCVGSRTGIGIRAADPAHRATPFDQGRAGLHHLCLRARSREDVDRVHGLVAGLGARVVHPPQEDDWAPGYYSVLFEDPGGTRLEVNHVPGKGWLDPERGLPLAGGLQSRLSES
ncbi:MAG TPA: VOC family protein [Thermoanaerobaculia bacterium]|nr:VOC family protein [Thermoanaerobaculia bacterium]